LIRHVVDKNLIERLENTAMLRNNTSYNVSHAIYAYSRCCVVCMGAYSLGVCVERVRESRTGCASMCIDAAAAAVTVFFDSLCSAWRVEDSPQRDKDRNM
jgi:hypothetical protein